MIRPFHLRDVGLVHRLSDRGVVFQAQAALTTVRHPVRNALVNMLVGGSNSNFIWKSTDPEAAAYVQLSMSDGSSNAHLASISVDVLQPERGGQPVSDEDIWLPLLDQVVVMAGQRGVHNLIAEVAEDGQELPLLRRAGFVVYTRQDIWINDGEVAEVPSGTLVKRQKLDDWDINVLYSSIVPGMIQSVEPSPPLDTGQNWVLREEGELTAYVHLCSGPVASWMRLFIHPNAQTKPTKIIGAVLQDRPPSADRPVYCCVRRYQSWLLSALDKAGFRPWASQAVMVKHIVQRVKSAAPELKAAMEPKAVPGSTSLIQGFSKGDHLNGH